jgi:hypothetical protein
MKVGGLAPCGTVRALQQENRLMTANDLRSELDRRPFRGLRIVTTDGTIYEVRHQDLVMVGLGSVIIGYPARDQNRVYERYDVVSLGHIIRLEPMGQEPAPAESA